MNASVSSWPWASAAIVSSHRDITRNLWIAGALGCFASSCGFITAGAASAASDDGSTSDAPAAITGFAVESAKVEPAHIRFTLADAESDSVEVELLYDAPDPDGSEPLQAVQGARLAHVRPLGGGPTLKNPMVLDASPQGELHTFEWMFTQEPSVPDAGGWTPDVFVYARIAGGVQALTPGANAARLGLGNDPPAIVDADKDGFADAQLPTDEVVGLVLVSFLASDTSEDQVGVAVEYALADGLDLDGGELPDASAFLPATEAGAGVGSIAATMGGTSVDFLWNPLADLGRTEHDVVFRITPDDGTLDELGNSVGIGATVLTRAFRVDNNTTPIVQIDSGSLIANADERRGIPVPYRVLDAESDLVDVVFQWRRPGEAFAELPADNAALDALLLDPLQRRQHRICSAYPRYARGRAVPVDATSLRLPELAQGENWCVAAGIEGRVLELLRPSSTPEPITPTWSANPLAGPVGALALGDGSTAIALDGAGPLAWRLREIELATGAVVREWVSSAPGSPSALAFERFERSVLVAADLSGAWSLARVDLASGAIEALFGAGSSLPAGPVRGLASLSRNTALVTVGDALLRLDWSDPLAARATVVLDGLATPWGIALDPTDGARVYLAERDAPTALGIGRVLAVDLDSYVALPVIVKTKSLAPGSLESPEALTFERRSARLLVVTREPGGPRLVGLGLGAKGANRSIPIGPVHPSDIASIATGADGLLLACVPSLGELLVGGGVAQRRVVTGYQASTQRIAVSEAFAPQPRVGQTWRLAPAPRVRAAPAGVDQTFVWNMGADVGHGSAFLRAIARDTEAGIAAQGTAPKQVRAALDVVPIALGGPALTFNPVSVTAADLDGDGDQDLVSANSFGSSVTVFFQSAPRSFDRSPLVLGGAFQFPRAVATADLDGDGDQDIVSANQSSTLTVFFQDAPGSFAGPPLVIGGPNTIANPSSVAAADLDGDGDQDLVCANEGSGTLRIFYQSSPGSFVVGHKLGGPAITEMPKSVAAADLDGDGDQDLVSANHNASLQTGNLTVFFRAPVGFDPAPLVLLDGIPFAGPEFVAAGDMDGDGDLDLVSANGSSINNNHLTVFFQSGPGVFDPTALVLELPVLSNPTSVAAADLDGDEDLDLVCANTNSNGTLTGFFQDAPGSFDPAPLVLTGSGSFSPTSVAASDLDGDGILDLVSASGGLSHTLEVFFQDAPGSFDPAPFELGGSSVSGDGSNSVAAADLDGDGDQDLVSAHTLTNDLRVFFQGTPGSFDPAPFELGGFPIIYRPATVATADLDGDGDLDLVSANEFSNNLTVFFQDALGSFDSVPLALAVPGETFGGGAHSVAASDLDGDGDLDLVSANPGSSTLTVFFQTGPRNFDRSPLVLGGPALTASPYSVVAADVDGDGDQDLVSANQAGDSLTAFFQIAPGVFDPLPLALGGFPITDGPLSVAAADLDGDVDLDLVSANSLGDDLTLFFQHAPGSFDSTPLELGGPAITVFPRAVAAADADADGDLDLLSANLLSNNLTVFFQDAPGSFDPTPLELGGPTMEDGPTGVAVADVDGDGDVDILSRTRDGALTVFFGSHR